jgi:hypothetical protein
VILQSRCAAVTPGGGVLQPHLGQSVTVSGQGSGSAVAKGRAHVNVHFVDRLRPLVHSLTCGVCNLD